MCARRFEPARGGLTQNTIFSGQSTMVTGMGDPGSGFLYFGAFGTPALEERTELTAWIPRIIDPKIES